MRRRRYGIRLGLNVDLSIVDYVRRTFFSWRMFSSELEKYGTLDKKLRQPGHQEVQPGSYLTGSEIFSISSLSLPFLRYHIIIYFRLSIHSEFLCSHWSLL